MKPPVYNEREMIAIRNADRVVVRRHLGPGRGWGEREFVCGREEVGRTIDKVEDALDEIPGGDRCMIYVGAVVRGERMLAAVERRR